MLSKLLIIHIYLQSSFLRVSAVSVNKQLDEDLAAPITISQLLQQNHTLRTEQCTLSWINSIKKSPYYQHSTSHFTSCYSRATGKPQPFTQNNSDNINFSTTQKYAEIIPVRWWKLICSGNKLYLPQLRSTWVCFYRSTGRRTS